MTDTERVRIEDVIWDAEFYPRESPSNDVVNRYQKALDRLPPIEINQNNRLVDGYHRLLAHTMAGKDEIEAVRLDIPDERVLEESIRRNAIHGHQLAIGDKRRMAVRIFGAQNGKIPERRKMLSDLLSVSLQAVTGWTKDQAQTEKEEENATIRALWLACHTEAEIGEAVGLDQKTVSRRLGKIQEDAKCLTVPDELQVYDRWNITSCDDRYGMTYPGRIPGQVVENLLYYWTEPGAVVLDPFAGSGTTADVCLAMGRRYILGDLRPSRKDRRIFKADAVEALPNPRPDLPVDLIFLDPPYWSMKDDDYPEGSISAAAGVGEFYDLMGKVAGNCFERLTDGGVCALYMMPMVRPGGEFYDLNAITARRFEAVGFRCERLIHGWIGNQHITGNEMAKAKDDRRLPNKTVLIELRIMRKP